MVGPDELQGRRLPQAHMPGPVDGPHTALSQLLQQVVLAEAAGENQLARQVELGG